MAFPAQSIWAIRPFKLIALEERMQHLGLKEQSIRRDRSEE
jgi:hypothetical protein